MKIAVVIPKYGLTGGAEGFAKALTERLALQNGFEIHVFANRYRRGAAPVIFHHVPILRFPRFMRQISFAFFADKQIQRGQFDRVHSHDRIFRMHFLTMHGIPHARWIRHARNKRLSLFDKSMSWVERKGLDSPDLRMVLPVSSLVKDELLQTYSIPEHRLQVVHPGISEERFISPDRERCRRLVRERHGISGTDVVALFVGMNFEIKRLGRVMEGLAHVAGGNPGAAGLKLLVAGKGDIAHYQSLARGLGILDRVVFAGVAKEVETYCFASDFFVMPSVFDTFGMAVLEAMAAGLPVIITQKVGARDLVRDGVSGFILDENPGPRYLGRTMARLLKPEQRTRMGAEARKTALQHTWGRVADQMAAILKT